MNLAEVALTLYIVHLIPPTLPWDNLHSQGKMRVWHAVKTQIRSEFQGRGEEKLFVTLAPRDPRGIAVATDLEIFQVRLQDEAFSFRIERRGSGYQNTISLWTQTCNLLLHYPSGRKKTVSQSRALFGSSLLCYSFQWEKQCVAVK